MANPFTDVLVFGVDDETVYNWFHDGPGTASTLDANSDMWLALSKACAEVAGIVGQGLAVSTAAWAGAAADVAHAALDSARVWADTTSDALRQVHDTILAQSSSFNETKAALSPPVVVPDKPWANDLWPGETNYDQALEAKQANNFRNVALMRVYGAVTSANAARYPDVAGSWSTGRAAADEIKTAADTQRPEGADQPVRRARPAPPGGDRLAVEPRTTPAADKSTPVPEVGPTPPSPPAPQRRAPEAETGTSGEHLADLTPSGAGTVTSGVLGAWTSDMLDNPTQGGPPSDRPATPRETGGHPVHAGPRSGSAALGEQLVHRAATIPAVRPGAPGGNGVVPGAGSRRDADDEHDNRFSVMDRHEDFWDDNPAVAPPVIGGDDD